MEPWNVARTRPGMLIQIYTSKILKREVTVFEENESFYCEIT